MTDEAPKMPRVIWAQPEHEDDPAYGNFWIRSKVAPSERYYHDDVVQELREALERARAWIHGPGDRSGPVLRQIDAALSATSADPANTPPDPSRVP